VKLNRPLFLRTLGFCFSFSCSLFASTQLQKNQACIDFPPEIMLKIFDYLPAKDYLNAGQVSKEWHYLSDYIWQCFAEENFNVSTKKSNCSWPKFVLWKDFIVRKNNLALLTKNDKLPSDKEGKYLAEIKGVFFWVNKNFQNINLFKSNLKKAQMINMNLSNALLRKSNLAFASLTCSNCQKADFREVYFKKTSLFRTDFSYACLQKAIFIEVLFDETNFQGADLQNALFENINLSKLAPHALKGANLSGARFEGCFYILSPIKNKKTLKKWLKNEEAYWDKENPPIIDGSSFIYRKIKSLLKIKH